MYDPVVSNSGALSSGLDIHAVDDSTHSLIGLSASGLKSLPTSPGSAETQLDLSLNGKKQLDGTIGSSVFNQNQYAGLELLHDTEDKAIGNLSNQSTNTDSLTTLHKNGQWVGNQEYDSLTGSTNYKEVSHIQGTLKADTFKYYLGSELTIFSGNGNVEFGEGKYDLLDLSKYHIGSLDLNLASIDGGGVEYDLGNGERVFDAITLKNGDQILFEGIEKIQFADDTQELTVVPNDPLFNEQWNLHMMGVHTAWNLTKGSTDVLIGIQDSGLAVDGNGNIHPDLDEPITLADNYIEDLSIEDLPLDVSHGTAVQGVTSAITNNGNGMSGINWNSDVFQIDVIGGETGDLSLGDAAEAMIAQAKQNGQKLVINMSLSSIDEDFSDAKLEQLIAAHQNDVLFVLSAGNERADSSVPINELKYPARLAAQYDNVIAVGAAYGEQDWNGNPTEPGMRASFSHYGQGLTLMGPTEFTSLLGAQTDFSTIFGSRLFGGTSAAAPSVAGVASLVWSANSNLTANQVKDILAGTAYDLGTEGYDLQTGYGFVNADAAVRQAIALT